MHATSGSGNTCSGCYRGKHQFSTSTWASVGGSGDSAAASEAGQDKRAAMPYSRTGPSSWPACGQERPDPYPAPPCP
jgi:hypothetical protein